MTARPAPLLAMIMHDREACASPCNGLARQGAVAVAVHKVSVAVHKVSVAVHKGSVAVHKVLVALPKSSSPSRALHFLGVHISCS